MIVFQRLFVGYIKIVAIVTEDTMRYR